MLFQYYPQVDHGYMYELNKDFHFAAAHFIPHADAGACSDVHGHTYVVNITVAGNQLDELGFLVNFSTLKKLVHKKFDHTLMNDHPEFTKSFKDGDPSQYPTTEVVAKTISDIINGYLEEKTVNTPKCLQVIVRETPTSYVVYRHKRHIGGPINVSDISVSTISNSKI
jgi:6-pyruvoyltetrahydropterin/6-carboxytetrahydropterin synthase